MVKVATVSFLTLALSFLVAASVVFGQAASPSPSARPTATPSMSPAASASPTVPGGAPSTGFGGN